MRPGDADDALIDAFAADSEGLPLHVVAALASGEAPGQAMPRGVHALLLERIASVSETAAQILSAAAIIGRSFDLGDRCARPAVGPRRRRSTRSRS